MKNIICLSLILLLLVLCLNTQVKSGEFLSTAEVSSISAGSAALCFSGYSLRRYDTTRTAKIEGTLPLDKAMIDLFGGSYYPGKTNFLDNSFGSALTPVAGAVLLTITDLSYVDHQKSKFFFQDIFLYGSGIVATKGVTDLAKGLFTRPRPYMFTGLGGDAHSEGFLTDRSSFFSGHTSGAFFAVSYLNLRIRSVMRSEMNSDDYKNYRWISPTVLYGWATFVGLSRIHAYKHYFSDVLIGAAAGYLMAELFYSFGSSDDSYSGTNGSTQMIIQLNFSF